MTKGQGAPTAPHDFDRSHLPSDALGGARCNNCGQREAYSTADCPGADSPSGTAAETKEVMPSEDSQGIARSEISAVTGAAHPNTTQASGPSLREK
jgi:hypothetical protein